MTEENKNVETIKREFLLLSIEYANMRCDYESPPKVHKRNNELIERRNAIYREFGEQVLSWPRS